MNKIIADMSTKEVIQHYQALFDQLEKKEQLALISALKEDKRKSVLSFANKLEKHYLLREQEVERQKLLWQYEKAH